MADDPCRYCDAEHDDRYLCDPGRKVLDALVERGMRFDMPTIEFPEPVYGMLGGDQPGDAFMQQLVIQGAVIEIAGVHWPALVLTGRDAEKPLPRWVYPAPAGDLNKAAALMRDMAHLAIRTARQQNAEAGRG